MKYFTEELKRHPLGDLQDAYKMCYQRAFGPTHILKNRNEALKCLEEELAGVEPSDGNLIEPISDKYCRVNLAVWKNRGLSAKELFALLEKSAESHVDEDFNCHVCEAVSAIRACGLTYADALLALVSCTEVSPVHHSDGYVKAYKPSYRVVSRELAIEYIK